MKQHQEGPMSTCKFYTNLYSTNQSFPAYALPYVLGFDKGATESKLLGMRAAHGSQYKFDFKFSQDEAPKDSGKFEDRAIISSPHREEFVFGATEFSA